MLRRCGWVLVVCSCFGDPPTASGSTDGDGPCTPGAHRCPCDAGACDPGLVCAPSVDRCVSNDCDVGELDCPCGDAMQCEGELVCVDGLCAGPDDMTPSTTTSSETTSTTGSDPSVSVTEIPMTSIAETTEAPMTSGEVSSGTAADTGGPVCQGGTCSDCFYCALAGEGPCGAEAAACSMDMMMTPVCYSVFYGWQMCEASQSCTCPDPSDAAGMALVECLIEECGGLDCHCF